MLCRCPWIKIGKLMKLIPHVFALMLLSGIASAQEQTLFNGKDLTGWDGKPGWWTVEDGVLTSESTADKKCHKANYLVWTGGEPADFELNLDFKLSPNTPKANSGVQIRSERRPDWDTFGYQADMTGNGHLVGYVYHHGRGLIAARGEKVNITTAGKREVEKLGDADKLNGAFKAGEWNHYRIVCNGPEITLYINDVLVCEFSDHDPKQARAKGIIALQMHPGPPMKVQFKNIVLKTLNGSVSPNREASLIEVLKSDAGVIEKRDACRELAYVGTAAAVPALAALLMDEKTSHMARCGLQHIPGPAADAALRAALQQLSGDSLAGVIHTIGQRGDHKAVDALISLLVSDDTRVAMASAAALGKIGTAKAAQGLQTALSGSEGMTQLAVIEGLFECADAFVADGQKDTASAIYDTLRTLPDATIGTRVAALRAAILVRGKDGLPLIAESLRSDDDLLADTALKTALEVKGPEVAELLAAEMTNVSVKRQVLLAGVLGQLGEDCALPVLLGLAKTGDDSVRLAAIHAATVIGGPNTIAPLMELMKDPNSGIAQAAASNLAGLKGANVDDAVVQRLSQNDSALQAKLAAVASLRGIEKALPVLLGLMEDPRDPVRLAAIKSSGELAGIEQLPVLLSAIKTRTQKSDIDALGKAIAMVCIKADDPKTCVPQLAAALEAAVPEAKPMLGKILKRVGGS